MSWTDVGGVKGWTGVKGVRDAKESVDLRSEVVSCEVSVCEMVSRRSGSRGRSSRSGSLNGWVSYKAWHRRNDESLSGSGSFLCIQGVSPVVPVVEASFNLSGPAGQWLAGTRPKSMWQGFHCRL